MSLNLNGESVLNDNESEYFFKLYYHSNELYLKWTIGDKIILSSGETATVLSLEIKTVGGPQTTYNFEVEDFHTYYVWASGVLVHNTCPTVNYNGEERVLYRCGDKFKYNLRDVELDASGNVLPTRGL